jgi:TonB-linked SusC/RagA family outer membrane protein
MASRRCQRGFSPLQIFSDTIKTLAPIYPVYYREADGSIKIDQWGEKMYDFARLYDLNRAGGVGGNCIFDNKYSNNQSVNSNSMVNGFAEFRLTDDLTLTLNGNAYNTDSRYTYITSPFVDYYTDSADNGYLSKSSSKVYSYNLQQLLNYGHSFGKHNVSALLGHEYYNYKYENIDASGRNFGIDGATEINQLLNKNYPSSYSTRYNNEGYFFRGMYDYNNIYYASVSYRRDASSRFSKDNRWGDFWSAGAAWVISKEKWFDAKWIDNLKLKASVGSQGNDNIGSFLYTDTYNIVNNNNQVGYQWRSKGTKNITWETNTNWNVGFEFEALNHRINGSFDYFYRKTTDMLFSLSTPPTIGYTNRYVNIGDMRNAGVELVLNATPFIKNNLRWDINFNITHVKNKVLSLPSEVKTITVEGHNGYVNHDPSFAEKYWYFVGEGLPLYTWHMPKYAGVDSATGEALYYKDVLDADGNVTGRETTKVWNDATDYLCGDAMPSFYGGIGTSLAFYGFDFSVNFNYQLGGKSYDYTYQTLMHTGGTTDTNWHVDILNAWSSDNTGSSIPRLRFNEANGSQNGRSDRFLKSATYLNCQSMNFGYTVPEKITKRASIEKVRVYLTAENLFYISERQGFDPRYNVAGYTNPELYSPMRTCSFGIQFTF